jgi:hypothetical protein
VNTETTTPDTVNDALARAYRMLLAVMPLMTPSQAETFGLLSVAENIAARVGGKPEPLPQHICDDLRIIGDQLLAAARDNLAEPDAAELLYVRTRLIGIASATGMDFDEGDF